LFIDEIRIGKIFNANESRNQIGFNIGGSITDLIIPYFTGYTEYTCVLPSVYQNINPAQYYTNYGFSMGDWMGNNFDRYLVGARYTPLPRFKVEARFQWSRKGAASSPEQQYLASPQPAFLFNKLYSQRELYFNLSYELTHNVYIKGNWTTINTIYQNETTNSIYNCMSLGVFWGL
jgi:hypothetical protein